MCYYSGKRHFIVPLCDTWWHVSSGSCQSPRSPHLSQPYGVTFHCHSEMRWLELCSQMSLLPKVSTPQLPQAKESQGLLFPLHSFGFRFSFQFSLKLTFCDCSFHFAFTPLSTQVQNTTSFLFCCAFPSKHHFESHLCLGRFYWGIWWWSEWGWGYRWQQSKVQPITLNRASDSPILEWVSAWQISLPKPQRHSPRFQPSPQHLPLSPFSSRAHHPSWWLPETLIISYFTRPSKVGPPGFPWFSRPCLGAHSFWPKSARQGILRQK